MQVEIWSTPLCALKSLQQDQLSWSFINIWGGMTFTPLYRYIPNTTSRNKDNFTIQCYVPLDKAFQIKVSHSITCSFCLRKQLEDFDWPYKTKGNIFSTIRDHTSWCVDEGQDGRKHDGKRGGGTISTGRNQDKQHNSIKKLQSNCLRRNRCNWPLCCWRIAGVQGTSLLLQWS